MNVFVPEVYDELITELAFGIEPIDAQRGTRIPGPLQVTFDECPRPLHTWRTFAPGVRLDDVLPRMERHDSGRYARVFDRLTPTDIKLRVSDARRRYVPRRLTVTIPAAGAGLGIEGRVLQVFMHPGANADLVSSMTALRGRVQRADGTPVRWCRVQATDITTSDVFGFAHGDDRGEFLLPLAPPQDAVGMAVNPLQVRLELGYLDPPPAPPITDPLVRVVDPIWDLTEETVAALPVPPPVAPAIGTVVDGRTFPAAYVRTTFLAPFTIPAGQTRPAVLTVP